MSYNVKLTKFFGWHENEGYAFEWPRQISKNSRNVIRSIVYKHNRLAMHLRENQSGTEGLLDNTYFLIFEEGAVLFRIVEHKNDMCIGSAVLGLYIDLDYLPTAWLMIDKLDRYLHAEGLEELTECMNRAVWEGEIERASMEVMISEEELDQIPPMSWKRPPLNESGNKEPISFAVSMIDPEIDNVFYYPNDFAKDVLDDFAKKMDLKNLEQLFSSVIFTNEKKIEETEDTFTISRNLVEKEKRGIKSIFSFKDKQDKPATWACNEKELLCLEAGKPVLFSKLLKECMSS